MTLRFSVLASGSSGNASLIEADGFGVLIDAGLGPRLLGSRLTAIDRSWSSVHAVVLTHTHADHWKERTFSQMQRLGIPLYCHPDHRQSLRMASSMFADLDRAQLVRDYQPGLPLHLSPSLTCTPVPVSHDDTTCGFRFEGAADLFGNPQTVGYAADLGCWKAAHVEALANTDILALEFNHDVVMERSSGRSPALIMRVLGDRGHLSNEQAAELLREVLKSSQPGRPRHVVQLHLSRHCNRPALAVGAAHVVLRQLRAEVTVHTAQQDRVGPILTLDGPRATKSPRTPARKKALAPPKQFQPLLPGWDGS